MAPPTKQRLANWNVRYSDGAFAFTLLAEATRGPLRTSEFTRKPKKPCAHISRAGNYQPVEALRRFFSEQGIKVLNVAGSRESKEPGLDIWVSRML